ncbi:hypothetical protein [Rhizobium yanglingense]
MRRRSPPISGDSGLLRRSWFLLVEGFQKENGLKPDGVVGQAIVRILTGGDTNA